MIDNIVYWKTKDGTMISVDDMDINHLRNVLKLIIKNTHKSKIKAQHSWKTVKLNGDMAQEFNESFPGDEYDEEPDMFADIY